MDLRPYNLSREQRETATRVLNYQPFIIADDIQTGVAYSILFSADPRVSPPLLFRRSKMTPSEWDRAVTANAGLRAMYDTFIGEVATRFPDKSLLDIGCNNGYFPVAAERLGMKDCAGIDGSPHHGESINFLNSVLGTHVEFFARTYVPEEGTVGPLPRKFDVVCLSAIMCHLPDPLRLLRYASSLANEGLLFWGQVLNTPHMLISYSVPHANLSESREFPWRFNDNTRISLGLLKHAMQELGFPNMYRLSGTEWMAPIEADRPSLDDELSAGSRHVGLLFTR